MSQHLLCTVFDNMLESEEPVDQLDGFAMHEQSSPESLKIRSASNTSVPYHQRPLNQGPYDINVADASLHHEAQGISPQPLCSSRHSSISSFPASVIHNVASTDTEDDDAVFNPSNSPASRPLESNPSATARHIASRNYVSPFRNPSSVLAMQMETDYSDSDALGLTPGHSQGSPIRRSPRPPQFSPRRNSPASSLHQSSLHSKKQSRPGTPSQLRGSQRSGSKLKKEFPLVLLHCTVLESKIADRKSTVSPDILEAVLPTPYNKRWRTLQDKVHQNLEIKQRGVLISHPHDDYDLLEERLLETLELQRPRLRQSHYLGRDRAAEVDSGFESAGSQRSDDGDDDDDKDENDDQADICSHKCPDCGKAISVETEQERKYEIKLYAANGLMKAGAWAAAWSEMEKVDIEIAVWMPEDVRTEVDTRLTALDAKAAEPTPECDSEARNPKSTRQRFSKTQARRNARTREIYGSDPVSPTSSAPQSQEQAEIFDESSRHVDPPQYQTSQPSVRHTKVSFEEPLASQVSHVEQPPRVLSRHQYLHRLLPDWARIVIQDQRNLVIIILCLVVFSFTVSQFRASNVTFKPPNSGPASVLLHTSEQEAVRSPRPVASDFEYTLSTSTVTGPAAADVTEVLINSGSSSAATEAASVISSSGDGSPAIKDLETQAPKRSQTPTSLPDVRHEDEETSSGDGLTTRQTSRNHGLESVELMPLGDNPLAHDAPNEYSQEQEHAHVSDMLYKGFIASSVEPPGPGAMSKRYSISEGMCYAKF